MALPPGKSVCPAMIYADAEFGIRVVCASVIAGPCVIICASFVCDCRTTVRVLSITTLEAPGASEYLVDDTITALPPATRV